MAQSRKARVKKEGDGVLAQNRQAQEKAARLKNEQATAARSAQTKQAADDVAPKEGDQVTLDVAGVPLALHTAQMGEAIRNLNAAGMHGRSGRLASFIDGPNGKLAVVEGADFIQQVPLAIVKRSDVFQREQNPPKRRAAKKAKKAGSKKVARPAKKK